MPPSTATIPTKKVPNVAIIKSQLKRIKTNHKRTERNRQSRASFAPGTASSRRSSLGDKDAAADALKTASKKLDKAVSKGVIPTNQAANKKSAMAKRPRPLTQTTGSTGPSSRPVRALTVTVS